MASIGWQWVPVQGMNMRPDELPEGRIICSCDKHVAAVIDGVVWDNGEPTRDGAVVIYGYWKEGGRRTRRSRSRAARAITDGGLDKPIPRGAASRRPYKRCCGLAGEGVDLDESGRLILVHGVRSFATGSVYHAWIYDPIDDTI